jgi:hypothetical protein
MKQEKATQVFDIISSFDICICCAHMLTGYDNFSEEANLCNMQWIPNLSNWIESQESFEFQDEDNSSIILL